MEMCENISIATEMNCLCRTCLLEKSKEELRFIFKTSLKDHLKEITSIKLDEHSALPSCICNDCFVTLTIAINFKDQCQKSEAQLLNALFPEQTEQTVIYRSITILKNDVEHVDVQGYTPSVITYLEKNSITNETDNSEETDCLLKNTDQCEVPNKVSNEPDRIQTSQEIHSIDINSFSGEDDEEEMHVAKTMTIAQAIQNNILNIDDLSNESQKSSFVVNELDGMGLNKDQNDCSKVPSVGDEIANRPNDALINESSSEANNLYKDDTSSEKDEDCSTNEYLASDMDNVDVNDKELLNEINSWDTNASSKISTNPTIDNDSNKSEVNLFNCKHCDKNFKQESWYKVHLIKHGEMLCCDICGEEFSKMTIYRSHLKEEHNDYRPHQCKFCKKSFNVSASLVKHMRIHGGDKKHLCTMCGKRFYEQSQLTLHTRSHTGEKPLICNTCGKGFANTHSLKTHMKIHSGERKYECHLCGKRFIHSFVLKAHQRTHTGEKPYKCSCCGAAFGSCSYLRVHERTHTNEKPFNCEYCEKKFISRCNLNAHLKSHTGEKKYQCTICGKRSGRVADLQTHMRSHTGEKPYVCDQCPKRYLTASHLAVHKKTHLGIKDQICWVCGKAFGDPRTLKSHQLTHTGEKPYVCTFCGNRYTQAGQLSAHRKIHIPSGAEEKYCGGEGS